MSVDTRPLLSAPQTDEERKSILEAERRRGATVVSAMLSEKTASPIVAYYLRKAALHLEIDSRKLSSDIVCSRRADAGFAIGLTRRVEEISAELHSRSIALEDSRNRYGGTLDDEEQSALASLSNLREHIQVYETLASMVETPPSQMRDVATFRNVAVAAFFHALDSSRSLRTMVASTSSADRLPCHSQLKPKNALKFFQLLADSTAKFTNLKIKSAEYIHQLRSILRIGVPSLPDPRKRKRKRM